MSSETSSTPIHDIDPDLFKFSHWGKTSRSSDDKITIDTEQYDFEDLGNGWYKAKSRFTVPDGVTMLRSFEIDKVQGDWDNLEIRKHQLRQVSDAITESKYNDSVSLATLADNSLTLKNELKALKQEEGKEYKLLKEKIELEEQIDVLKDTDSLNQAIADKEDAIYSQENKIQDLESEETEAYQNYQKEENNPLNYWCKIISRQKPSWIVRFYDTSKHLLYADVGANGNPYYTNNKFKFESTGGGYYRIVCLDKDRIIQVKKLNVNISGKIRDQERHVISSTTDSTDANSKEWQLKQQDDGYYIIESRQYKGKVWDWYTKEYDIFAHGENGNKNQQWKIEKISGETNDKIYRARQNWQDKQDALERANTKLKKLEGELQDLEENLENREERKVELEARLGIVTVELNQVRGELNSINSDFLDGVQESSDALTMTELKTDDRGLITWGSLLAFVNPTSRLNAIETCEGNVQLAYFDDQGRMRQTLYDATSDSLNTTFEQWIPDSLRTCLNFNNNSSVVKLNNPIDLGENSTIEAWFVSGFPEKRRYVLASSDNDQQQIVVQNGKLGLRINGEFFGCDYDLERLSSDWHHLAIATKQGQTTSEFYIDGEKVGSADAKLSSDIASLGNSTSPNAHYFGKLAEVRIWDISLSDEEVAVNSKTLLSGNEPGLLAYYPMTEATGTEVRDNSGNDYHGTIQVASLWGQGASWWGCAASIGNLGHQVMQFDDGSYINCGDEINLANSSFTIELWAKRNELEGLQCLIGQGEATPNHALSIGFRDSNNFFMTFWENAIDTPTQYDDCNWHHWACTYDSETKTQTVYCDGQLVASRTATSDTFAQGNFYIGSRFDLQNQFNGCIADVRIWDMARTPEQIRATMHQPLTGQEAGLIRYWPLNQIQPVTIFLGLNQIQPRKIVQTPELTGNHQGTAFKALLVKDSALPIGANALVSSEYGSIIIDPETQSKSAIIRRFFASPALNGAKLLPEKRIEELELQWIGNAQFAPTLLGYIEGAPPIPSENLTEGFDYSGATSVELNISEDIEFSWNRAQDSGSGVSFDLFAGGDTEVLAGLGVQAKVADVRAGVTGNLNFSYQFLNESNITSSSGTNMTDRLELRGMSEQTPKFPHLGNRFIPKNVGYALVISSLADVFITKLARSGKMVGYQVQPVDDIPPDVNTITFLINPAYTMNGSLDGMTGSSATSDRFFKHVPEMRNQYGSLYPASYYRLQEAYNLKQAIEQEDKRRESYFQQFNARLLDEDSLNREINSGQAPGSISVEREEDRPSTELTEEEQRAQEEAGLEQLQQETAASQDKQSAVVNKKQAEIEAEIADQDKRAHATNSFETWQKNMENILIRAGKRNIVNTYVWDGDGGMRTEAQSFANTAQHTIGGSFTLDAGLGVEGAFGVGGVAAELTSLTTVNLTQTMSKTETRSKGIELNVDLSGVEYLGITDNNDYPIQPGEKVDRYRFMSFYLEGSTDNFHDFFNYVVDPEWLRGNDEEARALRQAMGKANKTWRVLHRVTYVERPALMGFGGDLDLNLRQPTDEDQVTQTILDYFDELEARHQELKTMLTQILNNQQ
ncbi:LamG-like jellyroll fold domain-containing protein [Coleofasciculus chthonoplastes]|uniref:LamG-like jellyroll fold domain-containing protein n=1 Tax=Coleofasciculus chthonoplastes TaxID=64178 RepID=UPI0033054C7E